MEKLKQKVLLLQENINSAKSRVDKYDQDIEQKQLKIEEIGNEMGELNSNIATVDNDLEMAEEELIQLKSERKRLTDDEEDKDRTLRKMTRSVDQSKAGASGLQAKIQANGSKLEQLNAEIEDKENNINIYEKDLEMAEDANNVCKEELHALNMELAEATAVRQSISSSRATITGAGGNLRNLVTKQITALEKKKRELDEIESKTEQLESERDNLEDKTELVISKLAELKAENEKFIQELEDL